MLVTLPAVSNTNTSINIAEAKTKGKGLTVIVQLKYKHSQDPKYLKKVRLDIGGSKIFKEYFNLKDRPPTIKITGLDIPVNTKFNVCLNNILVDDGECSKGFNRPVSEPERIKILVP